MENTTDQILPQTPTPVLQTEVPKSSSRKLVVVAIATILFVLAIVPFPYYQSYELTCKPGQKCPGVGWHLGQSLAQSISRAIADAQPKRVEKTPTLTPKSTPLTTSWKTYTSKRDKFSINYPSDLQVFTGPDVPTVDFRKNDTLNTLVLRVERKFKEEKNNFNRIYSLADNTPVPKDIRNGGIITKLKSEASGNKMFVYYSLVPTNPAVAGVDYLLVALVKERENFAEITMYADSITNSHELNENLHKVLSTFSFLETHTSSVPSTWKTYTNSKWGLTLRYPTNYEVIENDRSILFIFSSTPNQPLLPSLEIRKTLTDPSKLPACNATTTPCLWNGEDWGQTNSIMEILVAGKSAKSFYVSKGVDSAFRIVQIPNYQLELEMSVAGGGLDQTFSQILSTFKFLDQPEPTPTK